MNLKEEKIIFGGEHLVLNNQRTLYWEKENALILSDLHLGKAAHFRKNGIAIPTQVTEKDVERLVYLIQHYQPVQVIIVGDFVHASNNEEIHSFSQIRTRFPGTKFILIRGNHDKQKDTFFYSIGLDAVAQSKQIGSLYLSHGDVQHNQQYSISGHIHPGKIISLPTERNKKLPCFIVDDGLLILPAFSSFTGLNTVHKYSGNEKYYACHQDFMIVL